jgi:polyhydroxyalkanoate synthesis regulator phasin
MIKRALLLQALAVSLVMTGQLAQAQSKGDQAILDALVRKGILTEKEADKISEEVSKEMTEGGGLGSKIQIGDWVKALKISADLRIRNQWDERDPLVLSNPATKTQDKHIQRDRWRFRLRLIADWELKDGFFGGVMLGTSDNRAADTKNATITGGYDNYNIYILRAFMGWRPTPGLTFIVGKQANPFYTTDLEWDSDFEPVGLVERIDFHKFFNMSFGEPGLSKEGKAPVAPPPPAPRNAFELSLIAGQFVFQNNNLNASNSQLKFDAYQFVTQLLTRLKLGSNFAFTFAPGLFVTNDAAAGATAVDSNGRLVPPTNTSFMGGQPLNNSQPFPITERNLLILLAPGDFTLNKVFGKPLSLYWDFAYNFDGSERFREDYGPLFGHYRFVSTKATEPTFFKPISAKMQDNMAWLIGLKWGENKKGGDWSLSVDYREQGITSLDPNTNNSNFHFSNLNSKGFEFNIAYSFTDFVTANVTGYISDALNGDIYGGFATGHVVGPNGAFLPASQQWPIARDRHDKVIQVNLVMKF